MNDILDKISYDEIFKLLCSIQEGRLTDKSFQNKIYYARKKKDLAKVINLLIAKELNNIYE